MAGFLLLVAGATVHAQQITNLPPIDPGDDGWVSVAAGASFGSQTQTRAAFAGEWGEDIIPNVVQAYVTVSYFDNLMRNGLTDDLAQLSANLTATTGIPWNLHGRDRGVSLIGGGRYLFSQGRIRPYVGGGGGVINLKRTIADARVGNVTSAVLTEFGIGELTITTQNLTRPLLEGAVGAVLFGGPVYVDVGYRYKRAFHLSDTLDFSQVIAAVGYRF